MSIAFSIMTSYVLTGDPELKNIFISNLIKDEDIPGYNLFNYQDTLKIPQAREIKKILEKDALSHKNRLFVIRDMTIEAQNALLKTLEELPADTTFVFLEESSLIPTIISRARVMNFERPKLEINASILNMAKNFTDNSRSPLLFSEELFSENSDVDIMDLIIVFREILFEKIENGEQDKIYFVLKLLKSLYKYAPLVENNNLNKRILIERIMLD